MQNMEQAMELGAASLSGLTTDAGGAERKRVEAVVETLATLRSRGESLAEAAHDARNMVTALGLYCDLLEEPGVLATPFGHYANELRLVATASRRLVEKLLALDSREAPRAATVLTGFLAGPVSRGVGRGEDEIGIGSRTERSRRWDLMPA